MQGSCNAMDGGGIRSVLGDATCAKIHHEESRLSEEVFEEVVMLLIWDDDRCPFNEYFVSGRGKEILQDLISLMQSGKWVYRVIMRLPRIWGYLIPAAKTPASWLRVRPRVLEAPMRVVYRDRISDLLDSAIGGACAIYAGGDCSWGNLTPDMLLDIDLSNLEVLYLRPDTRGDPPLTQQSPARPLVSPHMRICESTHPLVVQGPVERLGCSFFTPEQLVDVLAPLRCLRRIDFGGIQGDHVDLTSLIRGTGGGQDGAAHLDFLRIRCGASQSTPLNTFGMPIHSPNLQVLDVGGAIWVYAPLLKFARVYNTHAWEALTMIQNMPSLLRLHLRWRVPLDDLPPAIDEVHLGDLREVFIAGDMTEETAMFLSRIRAPRIRKLQLFCDMRAPPQPEALGSIAADIRAALHVFSTDAGGLRSRLSDLQTSVSDAGYDDLAEILIPAVVPALITTWDEPVEDVGHGARLNVLRERAQELLQAIEPLADSPAPPHAGFFMERVVGAALAIPGVHTAGSHLAIHDDGAAIHIDARARENTYSMKFCMPYSRTLAYGISHQYQRPGDSPAFGLARMLFGLVALRPHSLYLRGDPISQNTMTDSAADIRMLRTVLRRYDSVQTLHVDFSKARSGSRFIGLLEHAAVLPGLKRLQVTAPQYQELFDPFWVTLEEVVTERCERDQLLEVVLRGGVCISKAYATRMRAVTEMFELGTTCTEGGSQAKLCSVCSWRRST